MKTLFAGTVLGILTLTLVGNAPVPATAGTETHGGDAREHQAQVMPEEVLLPAITVARERLTGSPYKKQFTGAILAELEQLRSEQKYLVVPRLIVVDRGTPSEGGLAPQDFRSYLDLGAQTSRTKGDPIYIAERMLNYSPTELARWLVHEAVHRFVAYDFQDEEFVDAVAVSLMEGTYSRQLEIAAVHAIRIDANHLSGSGLIERVLDANLAFIKDYISDRDLKVAKAYFTRELRAKLSSLNLAHGSLATLANQLLSTARPAELSVGARGELINYFITAKEVQNIAREVDSGNPFLEVKRTWYCRITTPWYSPSCRDKDKVQLSDFFNPARLLGTTKK